MATLKTAPVDDPQRTFAHSADRRRSTLPLRPLGGETGAPPPITALLIAAVLVLILIPLFGALSDRLGRRPVYLFGALTATVLVMPACLLIDSGQVELLTIGIIVGLLGPAVMTGPQGSFFAELFGTRLRYTSASLGFQLGWPWSAGSRRSWPPAWSLPPAVSRPWACSWPGSAW